MAKLRALDLVRPFTVLMPEVQRAYSKPDQYEQLVYVVCCGILYCILSELPLYGVSKSLEVPDCLGPLRYATGSANGTPMDIGPSVIFLSGYILQILAGYKLLNVSLDLRTDRALFQSAQKLLAIFLTAALAALSVFSGVYGSPAFLGVSNCVFLVLQLVAGNLALILIDEVLTKGHGLGTGLLLFSTLKSAQKFSWELLSMLAIDTGRGAQTLGALPNLVFSFNSRSIKYAFTDAAFRKGLPNTTSLFVAVVSLFAWIWLSTLRYNLQITSSQARGQQQNFPVRLLYTNASPLLFVSSLLSVFLLVNSSIFLLAPQNKFVQLFGKWATEGGLRIPVGGLAYYVSLPTNWDPIRFATYWAFVTIVCGIFARLWLQSSGFSANDMTRSFKEQAIVLVGRRDQSVRRELKKTINPIVLLGGYITGSAAALFDILGGWGLSNGIGVLNMLNIYEILGSENISQDTIMNAQRQL